MSSRLWSWPTAALLVALAAGPVAAQPPSPLELVRGLRDAGMPDLALEYLREVEGKLTAEDKAAVPLERARCQLDAADDEPDEGTRTSMIGEAKEGFNTFLAANPKHPRAADALLALARLTSLEAKAQLNRARRIDVPPRDENEAAHAEGLDRQRKEGAKARPLFLLASKRFAEAAKALRARLDDKALDGPARRAAEREVFDADLAAAVNQFNLADTYLNPDTTQIVERDKLLEAARAQFAELAKGPPTSRTAWVARAWMAEILGEQKKPEEMAKEFDAILKVNAVEAAEGKRMVRFFQARRAYLDAITERPLTVARLQAAERLLRDWLKDFGAAARPTPEVLAARYYRAFALQLQAVVLTGNNETVGPTAKGYLAQAEKVYRELSQTDNDYTARATKNRMFVVRKILGEADRPAASYPTFEEAQMASLIQVAKLGDAERILADARDPADDPFWAAAAGKVGKANYEAEVKDRKQRVVALLERARELASDKDTPGDVADNLLRLIYFYQANDQPYQAAVLGEHVARTLRATGGKASIAGVMALNGYVTAATGVKAEAADPAAAEKVAAAAAAARKADRERAIAVARYLDKQFPNDTATDVARHQLATLLYQEGRPHEAFEAVVKVRPGYAQINGARQLEGFLAATLITATARDAPLPAGGKPAVFARAVADLSRVAPPGPTAAEDEVRGYVACRLRLAALYLAQSRVEDPALDALAGYEKALAAADEVVAKIPSFDALAGADKKPNLDGLELTYQGIDIRTRALYLRGKALVDAGKLDPAAAAINPAVEAVTKSGAMFDEKMRQWNGGQGDAGDDEATAAQKKKIAALAAAIDESRRNVVMVGFKLRAVQGKKDEAVAMLNLLEKAGGSVEASQAALELMGRELAGQIAAFKKEGKKAEAQALGDGLAELLKKIAAIPNRSTASTLFIGQTLHIVDQHDEAIKEFARIPAPAPVPEEQLKKMGLPANAPWWKVDATKIEDGQVRTKFQDEVRDHRFAQLYTAKAHRGAGRLDEAEKMLAAFMGTPQDQGWGYSSLDVRRELAALYEAKGAALGANVKAANAEWGKALKEWTTLFQIARRALETSQKEASPKDGAPPDPKRELTAQEKRLRNNFYDAYYEIQRVLVTANSQLLASNPQKLAGTFADVGKKVADMEKQDRFADAIAPEVRTKYCDLIDKHPQLKAAYTAAGGTFFLNRPK